MQLGTLSPAEESQLRSIAMPGYPTHSGPAYSGSPSSVSSPEPALPTRRKRKPTLIEDADDDSEIEEDVSSRRGSSKPLKKTAHNMIEKRYRTNLNDKIAILRDSVPSLRVVTKKTSNGEEIEEDLQGLTPASKLNKVCSRLISQ